MAVLRTARCLVFLLLGAAAGCFSPPKPPCVFSCADDGLCPAGYSCAADGVCHRDDGASTCNIPSQVDAAQDAASADAADGQVDTQSD